MAVSGDVGFKYSNLPMQLLGSVVFRNCTALKSRNASVMVNNIDSLSVIHPVEYLFDGCTLFGFNDGSGQSGIYFVTGRNTTFRNCVISGHEIGTTFTGGTKNILFDKCNFTTNRLGGFVLDDATSSDITVRNSQFSNNGAGTTGTGAAGIRVLDGDNLIIDGCWFGNPVSEPNQEIGVYAIEAAGAITLLNNRVVGVKAAGLNTGYVLSATTNSSHLNLVLNNTVGSGITTYSGPTHVPVARSGATGIYVTIGQSSFELP